MLGEELRRIRESRGLTLAAAARAIRGSTSKMSRLERGESPAKQRDVYDLAHFYGASAEELALLEQFLAQATNAEWYERFADVTPSFLRRLISAEGRAEQITIFENQVVPGLLQTEGYARALISLVRATPFSDSDAARTVALRIARQQILDQHLPRITAILDETILYRRRGTAAVMCEQMEHLLAAAKKPKVNVRIIGMHEVAPPMAITYLEFPNRILGDMAYLESVEGATYATQQRSLDNYRKALTEARQHAMLLDESIEAIEKAVRHWAKLADAESGDSGSAAGPGAVTSPPAESGS
ncbi:helix-turn-helix domain-containing protein [Streptomyces sp. NPDC058459]|uniref:helix-turn-helix domain-containing protein n=1 Tax=Streptomyces sp. NPDC058459 TaxID=3346508 RepID=UPI00366522B0